MTIPKKERKVSVKGKTFKIDDTICWQCGKEFDNSTPNLKKTFHHVIPVRYKPILNLKLPLCKGCHNKQNNEDKIYKRYYFMLKGIFDGTYKKLQNLKKKAI